MNAGINTPSLQVGTSQRLVWWSLKDLEVWYKDNIGKSTGVSKYTQKYMNVVLEISGGIANGLMKSLRNGQPLVDSESYPAIFKSCLLYTSDAADD